MGITDCHVHINPLWEMRPEVRAKMHTGGPAAEIDRFLKEPKAFLEYLDRCSVERAVLVNYVSPDVIGYTERTNPFVLDFCRSNPERLIPVGSVLPTHKEPGLELRRLHALGLKGVKIHPPHQLFAPNAYRDGLSGLREIYATAEELAMPVIFHTGTSTFPGARNRYAEPLLIEDVAIDFPKLTIVLAHGGRPLWMEQAMFLVRRFPNVFLEVSSIPPRRLLDYFPELARIGDRVLFGSDWPGPGVEDIRENLAQFQALPLPNELIERILTVTPERVFPRSAPSVDIAPA
ncbi:MAG: amidohydrolase family protein [Thermoplasmata archaeon]|nr:amidohydrolase family protein [Thermoplasmata archaeon]